MLGRRTLAALRENLAATVAHDESLLAAAAALSAKVQAAAALRSHATPAVFRRRQPRRARDMAGWNEVLRRQAARGDLQSASSAMFELMIVAKRPRVWRRLRHHEFHRESLMALGAALGSSPELGRAIGSGIFDAISPTVATRTLARTFADVVDVCVAARDRPAAFRWHRAILQNRHNLNERIVGASANAVFKVILSSEESEEEAYAFLKKMVAHRILPHRPHITRILSKYIRRTEVHRALECLATAQKADPYFPTQVFFNLVLQVAGDLGPHQHSVTILDQMNRIGVPPDVVSYTTAIRAAVKWGDEQTAITLLRTMHLQGIPPNVHTYSSVISACGAARNPVEALHTFRLMSRHRVTPNLVCYAALLKAISRLPARHDQTLRRSLFGATQLIWRQIQHSREFRHAGALLFNSVLVAFERLGHVDDLLSVWEEFVSHPSARPDVRSYTLVLRVLLDFERREEARQILHVMETTGVPSDERLKQILASHHLATSQEKP